MKKFWIIALAMLLCAAPIAATEQIDEPQMEVEAMSINIQGNRIHIINAEGKMLEIYNITGVRVTTIKIDSNDKQVTLNAGRGCYILKVGKFVRKITIR